MRNIHFYKAKSRIGITSNSLNQKEANIGVEEAPDAILNKEFLSIFNSRQVSEFIFPNPEDIDIKSYIGVLIAELVNFKNFINVSLKSKETQIVIGGDNCVTFSSFLALIERVKDVKKIGYIQFDSHGDMNLYKTSPSKNFHGMYLRPFLDKFDVSKIDSIVPLKVLLCNTLFIGDLNLDQEEKFYFAKEKLVNISKSMFLKDPRRVIGQISNFISRFEYLHINFDIDVFNKKEVAATGIPCLKGFILNEIADILATISKHPEISMDLCEVNPRKKGAEETIAVAQKVLKMIIS